MLQAPAVMTMLRLLQTPNNLLGRAQIARGLEASGGCHQSVCAAVIHILPKRQVTEAESYTSVIPSDHDSASCYLR